MENKNNVFIIIGVVTSIILLLFVGIIVYIFGMDLLYEFELIEVGK